MTDFLFWSATRIAQGIRLGNLRAVDVIDACLQRIDEVNPLINAVVQRADERARYEAMELDALAARGTINGPLHGVPITLKDSLDTEGLISTGGTQGRVDYLPDQDAPVVAALRAAGAVVLGKTNTPELTLGGETDNLVYGRTNNPYALERSPGGSSGGSASIIAAGGSALELGSDTGGSIREPAHLCGVAGIKPTAGRVPRTGHIIPYGAGVLDSLTQIGPIARYVEDLALALPLICEMDWRDPSVVPMPLYDPADVNLDELHLAMYTDNGVIKPCVDVVDTVRSVATSLVGDGSRITETTPSCIPQAAELFEQLLRAARGGNAMRLLERYGTTNPGPNLECLIKGELAEPKTVDPVLMESIDEVKSQALQFMRNYDAIICPASHDIARPHGASLQDDFLTWSHITVYNLFGWPAAVVRAGTSQHGNLPVGVQVVAAPWREDIALAVAARIEKLMGGYQKPDI
ncbi:MAG: amidase [Gammaproteobacteria bacterium]|nr:amidase [Gammaproteobacteria bacterium]MDH3466068.1 amidase [Gammaproteobacteria bacterium]